MSQTSSLSSRRPSIPMLLVVPLLLIMVAVAWIGWHAWQPRFASDMPATTVSTQAFEAQWGIRVTLVGVTADGGLIDLRYQVIDAQKAGGIATDQTSVPILIDEQSGIVIGSSVMSHAKHVMAAGQTYFQLYRNRHGAIQHGHPVTIRIGDVQIVHVIAQ